MPIAQTDQLFQLVKSLSKGEKRNFTLYVKRLNSNVGVKFIRLFEILDKQTNFDEAAIFDLLTGVKKSQYANLKRYLYSQILISLRLLYNDREQDIQIREQIDYARILYVKGLYLHSLKLLERIKLLAKSLHQDALLLEIIEFEKLIEARHITRSRKVKNRMERLIEESAELAEVIQNASKLSNLNLKIQGLYINMGFAKDEKEIFFVREYFQSLLLEIRTNNLSFGEHANLHQSYVWYYYIQQQYAKCYWHATKWVQLFRDDSAMFEMDPDLYMRAMNYLLMSLYNIGHVEKYKEEEEAFDEFYKKYHHRFNQNSEIFYFIYGYAAKLGRYMLEGNFAAGVKFLPRVEDELTRFSTQLDPHRIMVFYYRMGSICFGAGEYERALDYFNEILNDEMGHLRTDIQCYTRLMQMVCHYELGNWDLLTYLHQNTGRFFKKINDINRFQLEFLKFIQMLTRLPVSEHMDHFRKFRRKLEGLRDDPYERRAFIYMDALVYLDAKIEQLPMSAIVKRGMSSRANAKG
jgi:hypothetical protein